LPKDTSEVNQELCLCPLKPRLIGRKDLALRDAFRTNSRPNVAVDPAEIARLRSQGRRRPSERTRASPALVRCDRLICSCLANICWNCTRSAFDPVS